MNQTVHILQLINTVMNVLGVIGMFILTYLFYLNKRRIRERHAALNKRLDNLLLLVNELYQSEIKTNRKPLNDQEGAASKL
jgi:hypothetical protein